VSFSANWKGLAQLLDHPSTRRILGHIEVKDAPPVMRNDEEAVENAEGQPRHGKEIHRGYGLTMIAQKGLPALRRFWTSKSFSHPRQHRSFGDVEAKHFQLTMNARRTPGRVLGDHAKDQFAQFPADAFSSHAGPMPREPRPVQLEARPMLTNNSHRLNKNQCFPPSIPEPPQHHPEQSVRGSKPRLRKLLFEDAEVLPKSQVFHEQIAT